MIAAADSSSCHCSRTPTLRALQANLAGGAGALRSSYDRASHPPPAPSGAPGAHSRLRLPPCPNCCASPAFSGGLSSPPVPPPEQIAASSLHRRHGRRVARTRRTAIVVCSVASVRVSGSGSSVEAGFFCACMASGCGFWAVVADSSGSLAGIDPDWTIACCDRRHATDCGAIAWDASFHGSGYEKVDGEIPWRLSGSLLRGLYFFQGGMLAAAAIRVTALMPTLTLSISNV